MVHSQLNSRLGFINPGLTLDPFQLFYPLLRLSPALVRKAKGEPLAALAEAAKLW
jgi:hypothetical protein